ncbi:MAG: secretion protein F [Ruminococcus sp.]|nr:secretion protein F [Ruminococcus sp.]
MVYVYLFVIGSYLLLFLLSRKEDISSYREGQVKKRFPGEVLFLKGASWCIRCRERFSAYFSRKNAGRMYEKRLERNRLGQNLKLLHPELSEGYQIREFYIKQYSLALSVLFAGNLLSLCVAFSAQSARIVQEGGYINRRSYGEGDIEVSLLAQIEGEEGSEISYTVEERKYDAEEITCLYKEASALLPKIILGDNSSLESVTENLQLVSAIEGYPFSIAWESNSYSLIHTDGTVCNETLQEAQIVMLRAYFRYEETEFEEVFPVQVRPAVLTKEETVLKNIKESLAAQDEKSRTDTVMLLPEQIGTKNIIWKEVIQDSSGYFFLLMCIAAVLVFLSKNKEVEQNLEKRSRELLLDYPEIVNKLTLYMGAGMTVRSAFWKMGEDYKKQKVSDRKRYVYEEILLLCHELQSGVSETEVYAHLGKRCRLQPYMKLSALLSQNLRKGSNDLLRMLRQEVTSAFEERKNTAKKAGEEAGTKLLIPMMMMLCIVMVLIMIPAFFSFH